MSIPAGHIKHVPDWNNYMNATVCAMTQYVIARGLTIPYGGVSPANKNVLLLPWLKIAVNGIDKRASLD